MELKPLEREPALRDPSQPLAGTVRHRALAHRWPRLKVGVPLSEFVFDGITGAAALTVVVLLLAVTTVVIIEAWPAVGRFGLRFLTSTDWDPANEQFGALPFIYGTVVSSLLALAVAAPFGIGVALCLSEMAPFWLSDILGFLVELLGAIPAVMVVPYVSAVCRDVFSAVPASLREAAYALGATRWEMVRMAVLPHSVSGIVGALILGLGRALGETIAVAMVIGNRPAISASLFMPSTTLASAIANEFTEATSDLYVSALIELGMVLILISLLVNVTARLLIYNLTRRRFSS